MKASEITRIVFFGVIGFFIMFVLQPLLYTRRLIDLSDVNDIQNWVGDVYIKGATIVFFASVIATLVWLFFAATSKGHKADDVHKSQPIWWVIGLIPIVGIGLALAINSNPSDGSNDALMPLTFFYVIDVFILYWLATATSTPGSLMYIPPLSDKMRDFIGD